MDGAITRAEHEAFSDLMKAENKRLEEENNRKKLENRDGDMWRTVVKYVITAVAGGLVTFALTRIGI